MRLGNDSIRVVPDELFSSAAPINFSNRRGLTTNFLWINGYEICTGTEVSHSAPEEIVERGRQIGLRALEESNLELMLREGVCPITFSSLFGLRLESDEIVEVNTSWRDPVALSYVQRRVNNRWETTETLQQALHFANTRWRSLWMDRVVKHTRNSESSWSTFGTAPYLTCDVLAVIPAEGEIPGGLKKGSTSKLMEEARQAFQADVAAGITRWSHCGVSGRGWWYLSIVSASPVSRVLFDIAIAGHEVPGWRAEKIRTALRDFKVRDIVACDRGWIYNERAAAASRGALYLTRESDVAIAVSFVLLLYLEERKLGGFKHVVGRYGSVGGHFGILLAQLKSLSSAKLPRGTRSLTSRLALGILYGIQCDDGLPEEWLMISAPAISYGLFLRRDSAFWNAPMYDPSDRTATAVSFFYRLGNSPHTDEASMSRHLARALEMDVSSSLGLDLGTTVGQLERFLQLHSFLSFGAGIILPVSSGLFSWRSDWLQRALPDGMCALPAPAMFHLTSEMIEKWRDRANNIKNGGATLAGIMARRKREILGVTHSRIWISGDGPPSDLEIVRLYKSGGETRALPTSVKQWQRRRAWSRWLNWLQSWANRGMVAPSSSFAVVLMTRYHIDQFHCCLCLEVASQDGPTHIFSSIVVPSQSPNPVPSSYGFHASSGHFIFNARQTWWAVHPTVPLFEPFIQLYDLRTNPISSVAPQPVAVVGIATQSLPPNAFQPSTIEWGHDSNAAACSYDFMVPALGYGAVGLCKL